MIDLTGRYSLELSNGTARTGELRGSSCKVRDADEGPEVVALVVLFDDGPPTATDEGRARLELRVEAGTGRMRGAVRVPLGPRQDAWLVLDELTGSARWKLGVLHVELEGRGRRGDVEIAGRLEVPLDARIGVVLDVGSVAFGERALDFQPHVHGEEAPRVARITALLPSQWRVSESTAMALRLSHGFAVFSIGVGACELVGDELEREAQTARTRARATAANAAVVRLSENCVVVRLEGTRPGAILHGYVGFPGRSFYATTYLAGMPDLDAWNDRFADLTMSIREGRER